MPSANGVYTLPVGYLAVTGQTIQVSQHNPPLEDMAAALTGRLSRDGTAPMTGPLQATAGLVGAPSYTFQSSNSTGFYKTTNGIGITISGTLVAEITASGVPIADQAVTYQKIQAPSAAARLLGSNNNAALSITAAASAAGLIRLVVASTATFTTGQKKIVAGVGGTTEANGRWTITVVDSTHIDLQGSTFVNAYTSGGTIGGGVDEVKLGTGLTLQGDTLNAAVSASFLSGLTLSTAGSSATFGIASGAANDSTAVSLMNLASAYTKTTAAWVVGTGNGALDTGALANSTWYHVFLIQRVDTNVVDVLFSLSATAPTLPTNYTLFRRIGSIKTDGSAHWLKFLQTGDLVLWDVPVTDLSVALGSVATNLTLSVAPSVVQAVFIVFLNISSSGAMNSTFYCPNVGTAPTIAQLQGAASSLIAQQLNVLTNSSGQVRHVESSTNGNVSVQTLGWYDSRGKL